jgi:drug/metabolite transporter (DMT)-like permease
MTRRQIFAFILICVIWGSTWAAIRVAVLQVPPLRLAALRFVLAGLVMLPIALRRGMVFPRGRALEATLWLGVFLIGLQYALVFCAERYISSGLTAILYASSPLVVGIVTPSMLKRPVPRAAMTAMLVGVGGLALLLRSILSTSSAQLVPALVLLVAMAISSVSSVYASRELQNVSAFAATAVQFLVGGVILAALSLIFERHAVAQWTYSAIGSLAFLIVFSSIIGFSLYFWLLQSVEPYRVVTVQFLIPVISVVEGTMLLREPIPLLELCGGLVVLSAVFLVLRVPPDDDSYQKITPR